MKTTVIKWVAGSIAFFLPTISTVVATSVLKRSLPELFWVSILVAATVPPALIFSSSLRWRIALGFGLWLLLAAQFCLILVWLLAGFRS